MPTYGAPYPRLASQLLMIADIRGVANAAIALRRHFAPTHAAIGSALDFVHALMPMMLRHLCATSLSARAMMMMAMRIYISR